jgi:hypothetical protein
MTHRIHKEGDLQIHFFVILWNKAPRTGPRQVCRTYTLCPFFGCEKNTDGSTVVLLISLGSVCYGDSRVAKHFLHPHLVFQPIWGWGSLGSFQLPQSNSSPEGAWNLGGLYLAPHEDNSIQLLSIANNYSSLPSLVSTIWLAHFQKPGATEVMDVFYSDSKTDLQLRCNCSIKLQLFEGA